MTDTTGTTDFSDEPGTSGERPTELTPQGESRSATGKSTATSSESPGDLGRALLFGAATIAVGLVSQALLRKKVEKQRIAEFEKQRALELENQRAMELERQRAERRPNRTDAPRSTIGGAPSEESLRRVADAMRAQEESRRRWQQAQDMMNTSLNATAEANKALGRMGQS